MKPSIILFGASKGGLAALDELKGRVRVVAFADNDPSKHGTFVRRIPVIAPTAISSRVFDGVVIASMYAEQIRPQLMGLGVPEDRIHVFRPFVNQPDPAFPWDAVIFLGLGLAVLGGLSGWLFWSCAG